MDTGLDTIQALRGSTPMRASAAESFDWHGLRARLTAAHAFRGAWSQAPAAEPRGAGFTPCGSFDADAARAIALWHTPAAARIAHPSPDVNPTALGDGKCPGGRPRDEAGAPAAGRTRLG